MQEGVGGKGAAGRKVSEGETGERKRDREICRDGRGGAEGWRARVEAEAVRGVRGRWEAVDAEKRRRGALGRALASRTHSQDRLPLGKISAPL